MSDYSVGFAVTLTAPGTRTVEGKTISDPLVASIDPETFSTSSANKLLARKAISLTSGQSESLNPASFTGPLGDSGSMSFVQGWFLQNTGEDPVAGTLRLNFGNSEFLEVRPGAFVSGAMPQRAATQTGWDASTSFVVDCVGGSGTTSGILVITGNPSA